jgi:excisionase family DNA binding protein
MTNEELNSYISKQQAAKLLGISSMTMDRWIKRNRYAPLANFTRVGWTWLIHKSEIEKVREIRQFEKDHPAKLPSVEDLMKRIVTE